MRGLRFLDAARVLSLAVQLATGGVEQLWSATENEVKAASVCNVVKFVEWPADALAQEQAFSMCIVEPDILGTSLAGLVHNRPAGARPIALRKIKAGERLHSCHAVFVSARSPRKTAAVLHELQGLPILTLGDTPDFVEAGGMIALIVIDGRLQLQINGENVKPSRLHVHPQLLRLAQPVRGQKP